MGVVSWREIDRYFVDAYCNAAQAGAEMRAASNAIEKLRDAVLAIPAGKSIMEAWAVFDEQIGLADLERLMPVLVVLRDEFKKIATEREIFRLQRAIDRDRENGWQQWLETYARSFSPWGWRSSYGLEITLRGLKYYSPSHEWPLSRIREAAALVDKSRWSETYDWFIFLSGQEIAVELRVQMLATAAEIQLYHFYQLSKAKALLEQADRLAEDDPRLKIVWGEYWMQKEDYTRAAECFEHVIQGMPEIADGYVNMGDYYDQTGIPARAEDLYQQAVVNAPGALDGYRRLINFHGNSARFSEREERLAPLFKRILSLDDDLPYAYLSMGLVYKENRLFERALGYFNQAIEEDHDYSLAYIWKGYTYLDQISDPNRDSALIESARACFEKAAELAPNTIDGNWGIMRLEMQTGNAEAALEACNRCFGVHPEWESFVLVGRADIYRQLGQLQLAESDLVRSLEIEPDNPGAISVLTSLAGAYQTEEDKAVTMRALETVRRYQGDSYEQTYQNLIGNMHYYFGEYAEAARRYRLAVSAAPDDDVLHSNLALACERIKTPGQRLTELEEAIQHLQQAIALNKNEPEYHTRLHNLESEREFIHVYGEDARGFTPVVPAIRIRASDELLADILDDDQTDLSEDSRKAINTVRDRLRELMGVELPGVLFSYLEKTYSQSGRYEIYFQDDFQDFGYAEPGKIFARMEADGAAPDDLGATPYGQWLDESAEPTGPERESFAEFFTIPEYLLEHMARLAYANPSALFGFQDMINLLTACDETTINEIRKSRQEMLRYGQVLKHLLDRKVSLKDIQKISQEYLSIRQDTEDVDLIADQIARLAAAESSQA